MSPPDRSSQRPHPPRPPAVDRLVREGDGRGLPRPLLVELARDATEAVRAGLAADAVEAYDRAVAAAATTRLQKVINATGVLLHTNLGRAPTEADAHGGWSNLEYDLAAGARDSRHRHAATTIALACGAGAALVVNNNAAAVLLGLSALCAGREVLVSRGEAVEIGGGFRIPEILAASGARLVDVGTTNRTRVGDYVAAMNARTAAVLTVHPSNFEVSGFVERPDLGEIATAAHERNVLVLADIGSGLIDETTPWLDGGQPAWLRGEPGALQTLRRGADVTFFSADKLFGGPQAGVAAGRKDLIERLRRHPLARALRVDKHRLWMLEATARSYLDGTAAIDVPFWRMATAPMATRAADLAVAIKTAVPAPAATVDVIPGMSLIGAGSAPGAGIPTSLVSVSTGHPDRVATDLRRCAPPVVARVEGGAVLIDLRTVAPADDATLAACLTSVLSSSTTDTSGGPNRSG